MVFKIDQVQTSRQDRPASLFRDDYTSGTQHSHLTRLLYAAFSACNHILKSLHVTEANL